MAGIRIVTARAPGLIPSLVREIQRAERAVVLIPESFTLACETEIIRRSGADGIFDLKIFSPSSLVREIRELAGNSGRKPISGDGQNMIISRLLHHHREELQYYRDSAAQPTLAAKISAQIDEFSRARLTADFLREYQPESRRTAAKLADVAMIWDGYREALSQGFEDTVGQWISAVGQVRKSGIVRDARLLIYGFDYITHDLLSLAEAAAFGDGPNAAAEVVFGLVCDEDGPDRAIFRAAGDSVLALTDYLSRHGMAYALERAENPPPEDPGIGYVEQSIYASGPFAAGKVYSRGEGRTVIREDPRKVREAAMAELSRAYVPDLSHVHLYYAKNSYLECQHACQTMIEWHRKGIPWEDMAVAVCEQNTLPSLLPLTMAAAGIPFNAKQDQPVLMSGYAQYFMSLLRIMRLNYSQEDVLRLIKTGFTPLTPVDVMDMENYARKNGIHRNRWLKPFRLPEEETERETAARLEKMRRQVIEPIEKLRKELSRKGRTGREAAETLFSFITAAGVYDRLLEQEEALAEQGDDAGIDRNRQVWTAVNELLDTAASFIGEEPIPLKDLCAMLEASLSARSVKSLPQLSGAVMVAPPQMFFSSGIRCVIVMGLQEDELSSGAGILSEQERGRLEAFIEEENQKYYSRSPEERAAAGDAGERPYSRIGQSLTDLAARQKQDIYQAVSLAREELTLSCSGARPSGGIMTPSTAFRRLEKTVGNVNPENVSGSLLKDDLRPFAPAFALEALAVRLREGRDSGTGFWTDEDPESPAGKPGAAGRERPAEWEGTGGMPAASEPAETKPEDTLWRNALGSLYQSPQWRTKVLGVLNGLRVAAPSGRISPEQAGRLYLSRGMTISRVETFGSCPYRHFLQYGLNLRSNGVYSFRRDEQGTFNHDVLKLFLDMAMKLPEWPDLSEETETRLLNRALRENTRRWEGGILTSDTAHRYQGAGIIRGIRTSIGSLMRSFRQKPHFLPMAAEVPFGTSSGEDGELRLPAIQIRTADGQQVAFTGRIDRIDRLETGDGRKFFMIVDNKMASKEVRQNSITAGLQLQLPLYIRAAQQGLRGYEPAGGLYQPIRDVLVEGEREDQVFSLVDRALQTSGMILDDGEIQDAMKPVKIGKKTNSNDTISAVTEEEISRVTEEAVRVVEDSVNRIRGGEVRPRPVQDGQTAPCTWCDHADACLYDSTLPGCAIPVLNHRREPVTEAPGDKPRG